MSLAVIDARQWQKLMDLRTGRKMRDESPQTLLLRSVLEKHPYPGDENTDSDRWVSDTALSLIAQYQPQLACLFYARPYFTGRFTRMSDSERENMLDAVFKEVQRFVEISGYSPVIVGSGDMIEVEGEIDLNDMDGLAISSHWSARYAGLHHASRLDLDYLRVQPEIEEIVHRDEWIRLFPETDPYKERIPEYLLLARKGYSFLTAGTPMRKAIRIPGPGFEIPVATSLGNAETVTDIRNLILSNLGHNRTALIIIEGVGINDFRIPFEPCRNSRDWYYYEPAEALYLTLSTGKHQAFAYPSGYAYYDENDAKSDFPFSGYFLDIPQHTIAGDFNGRSIAVGNHSMFVHMVFGADICVECFARNLYNQGCLGVIHRIRQ